MKSWLGDALVIAFVIATILLFSSCGTILNAIQCDALGNETGLETRFALFGGGDKNCLINVGGEWIPTTNWRVID